MLRTRTRRVRARGSAALLRPAPRSLATRPASPTGAARHHRRSEGERAGSALGPGLTRSGSQRCLCGSRRAGPVLPARSARLSQRAPVFWGAEIRAGAPQGPHSGKDAAAGPPPGDGVRRGRLRLLRRVYRKHTQSKTKIAPGASGVSRRPHLETEAGAAPGPVGVMSLGWGRVVTAGVYRGMEPRSPRGSTGPAAAARCWISAAVAN